jgi:hypothetical protein
MEESLLAGLGLIFIRFGSNTPRLAAHLSFRRKPESRENGHPWTPAFVGVTALMALYG